MDIEKWGRLVSNVGFAIVVALLLLLRVDPALRELNESIIKLTAVIDARLR
jgi:hypothetical protein